MKGGAKIPRVFGRQIISDVVLIEGQRDKRTEREINFVIAHTDFELYLKDWSKGLTMIPIAHTKCEDTGPDQIKVSWERQDGKTVAVELRSPRVDYIKSYCPGNDDKKKGESGGAVTTVEEADFMEFSCGQHMKPMQDQFKRLLEAHAKRRVMFLTNTSNVSAPVVNAIAVEFKMRFPKSKPENWSESFEVLWYEFVAFCVSLWVQCLKNVIEPHTGPNSVEYFRRLAASLSGLIARGADVFQVDRREFLLAARRFIELGDASDIPMTSRQIVNDVELALGNVRKRWLLQLTDLFEFTQVYSVGICIAQAMGNVTPEIRKLSEGLVSWSFSLIDNLTRGPKVSDFKFGFERIAVSVLQANDKARYSDDYHCVFALWKLCELAKSSE